MTVQPTLTLAIIQSALHWEDKKANLISFKQKIQEINFDCDIVLLPEMFTTGFTMNAKDLAETMTGQSIAWMKETAKDSGKILCGSFICEENGIYYNRLVWMNPDGSFQHYDKKHLFRMANEDAYYSSGESNILIEYKGWKIRPLICYDLRFPVWCRNRHLIEKNQAIPEFDVMFFVANWPAVRSLPWDVLLRARAVENQVYCLGVNRVGKDGNEKDYNGHSAAIDPKGEYLLEPVDGIEGTFRVELKHSSLQAFRKKFPQGLDADNFSLSN